MKQTIGIKINAEAKSSLGGTKEQELQEYILRLKEAEKESVLQFLKTFVQCREQRADRIRIEQYNKELEEAEAEFEQGEFITHEEVVRMSKDW